MRCDKSGDWSANAKRVKDRVITGDRLHLLGRQLQLFKGVCKAWTEVELH